MLEGGYDLGALARSVVITLETVGAEHAAGVPEVDVHPLATRARERLARQHWPSLA